MQHKLQQPDQLLAVAVQEAIVAHGDDVVLAQHATIEVLSKIGDGLVATAQMLATDHPSFGQSGLHGKSIVLERLQPLGAKDHGQTVLAEQPPFGRGRRQSFLPLPSRTWAR